MLWSPQSSPLLILPLLLALPSNDATNNNGSSRWRGASCCREAVVPGCAVACKRATSVPELERHCRRSHEGELYNCLSEQKRAKGGKNGKARDYIEDEEIQEVIKCCQGASSGPCRTACRELQEAAPAAREAALTRLQDTACGQEDAAFWECHGGGPPAPELPSHRLELHCCPLGDTAQCRQLCTHTYSLRWHDQGPRFETRCLDANFGETRMRHCIRDAEAPCLPSSGRLHFCKGVTDEGSRLYRRWDKGADDNAKSEFLGWMRTGALGLSFRNLSIITTGRCKTELKRLACLLHLRPCRRSDHEPAQLCRSDCVRLLETCLSPAGDEADPATLCELMAAPEPDCVRAMTLDTSPLSVSENTLEPELPQGDETQWRSQVTSPCHPSPCEAGMVCRVAAPNLSTRHCLPGCRLSTVSNSMVALGSSVLLPPVGGDGGHLSLLLCAPDPGGGPPQLTRCTSVTVPSSIPCDAFDTKIDSGTVVHQRCLSCVCVDGDLLCRTAPECLKSSRPLKSAASVGALQPTCVHIHTQRCVPSQLNFDPCEVRPCPTGHRCLPQPDICVDSLQPCELHTCVPEAPGAITEAAATCQRSQSSVLATEESDWHQPYVACPVSAEECDAPLPPCGTAGDNGTVLPPCGSALRLYFSRRRLAALGSPVPARSVLSALRRLVGTAECALTGRLEAARQLTVMVIGERPAAAAVCRLEADKLRVWLSSGSPAVASEPALWPVVFAEMVLDPAASGAAVTSGPAALVLVLAGVVRWCLAR
ncbi:reversion-inducing cysteine-rich protein with Kazal motifs-like isoform X2 [Amphibalanus amphitrite]|uniref:reversion-inducing cysteine-rich protein with Kazal motifs-like isoform X2 n=1 Tax=Amphibalanus amphitrite TaxID=1232801 RepID=UPI001C910647|nr:reversion-inducing cysteine-rich protein with Kazal motifs-like isoform X2 [Amphibalanus amphitrite]